MKKLRSTTRAKKKYGALMERSCTAMCEGRVWGTGDHKALVDALDGLLDELRAVNGRLMEVAGMATSEVMVGASQVEALLREERGVLRAIRTEALRRGDGIKEMQRELPL